MKNLLSALLLTIVICLTISAQQITKPTLTPTEPTPEQAALIREGISFHDDKMYPEAIAKYREVLQENKDCVTAMYELALTYYAQKDFDKALEVALIGSKYKSDQLPIFYGMIGNIVDDQGNPQKAIGLYQEGIKLLKENNGQRNHLSNLYFNLGVTHFRQKSYPEARQAFKESIEYNFSYGSPNYLLAALFNGTRYKVPALLAAGRFISLESDTQRTKTAAQIIIEVLNGSTVKQGDKTIITLNQDAPTDEGDFAAMELFLGLGKAGADTLEKNKDKTEEEKFVGQLESFIKLFIEMPDKKLKNTFVGKNYLPFFTEMKNKGHIEAFAYLVLRTTGKPEAFLWITKNKAKVEDFLYWAENYQPK